MVGKEGRRDKAGNKGPGGGETLFPRTKAWSQIFKSPPTYCPALKRLNEPQTNLVRKSPDTEFLPWGTVFCGYNGKGGRRGVMCAE